ncbi:MAG: hypothetical protein JWO36_6056 [Myxococcales bacterium]|nr:hypothetical protein [Myxococcales bacterium]
MQDQLTELVNRIAQTALQQHQSNASDNAPRIAAIKAALDEHAEDGTFGEWGVLARDQLKRLQITVGFDARARAFVANTAEIAEQIRRIGAFD